MVSFTPPHCYLFLFFFFSLFIYLRWSQQLVWQYRAGRGKFHLWFQLRAAGLRGQAGRCPSEEGQVSVLLRLNAHWWLLWWCGGGYGGVVINISPGLIPLVHKQRLELLWELSTKVWGPLRDVPQVCLASCWCLIAGVALAAQLRTFGEPAEGSEQHFREMKPTAGIGRDGGRDLRAGTWGHKEITGHCFKLTGRFCCNA